MSRIKLLSVYIVLALFMALAWDGAVAIVCSLFKWDLAISSLVILGVIIVAFCLLTLSMCAAASRNNNGDN